jgi:hypothetical protein
MMTQHLLKLATNNGVSTTHAKEDVKINLGFLAGQQPGAFNYRVEPDKFDVSLGEILHYSLNNWSKTRTSTIQSLDELSKSNVEVYLNTQPVTNKSLDYIFSNPGKYDLAEYQGERTGEDKCYNIKLVCLVSQTGGGG